MTTIRKTGRARGKKPVDLVAQAGYRSPQDLIWLAIRTLRVFTFQALDIWLSKNNKSVINNYTTRSFIERLRKGGFIVLTDIRTDHGIGKIKTYELVKDVGVHTPRLTNDGKPTTRGMGRDNMWRSMKILGTFDYVDLAGVSTTELFKVSEIDAKYYIKHLYKAGYLQLKTASSQKNVTPARYRLIPSMNTGGLPPMIQRVKQVFDPNLNKVVWPVRGDA